MTLLIWDFDGTLADSFAAIRSAAAIAFAENGLAPVADDRLRGVVGLGLTEAFQHLLDDAAAADGGAGVGGASLVEAVVASYRTAWRRPEADEILLFDGIAGLLADLAAEGVPMAIATGKGRRGATEALAALGIDSYFDPVVTVDDVEHGKPHPDMVLAACAARNVPPAEAVVVGDSSFDVEMGNRAGATTVAVTWGNQPLAQLVATHPTHVVDDLDALRRVLTGWLAVSRQS